MAKRLPELSLSVQYPGGKTDAPTRSDVRRYVRASCALNAEITVRFVDPNEGRQLNHNYRGKDYATNVLSFPYLCTEVQLAGDLVLCIEVASREATEQRKPLPEHLAHLIVHGMLHLQGYDHEQGAREARRMEAREREILATLGIADPYRAR